MKNIRTIAVIPARAGSKRLPGKNVKNLAGKPLIQWTIEAASAASRIDKIIVSTDCHDVILLASKFGRYAPFVRPAELSGDEANSSDVAIHAIRYMKEIGESFDYIVFLQPTSPLRTSKHIDEALEFCMKNKYDSCVSVCEVEHSPLWSAKLDLKKGSLNFLGTKDDLGSRSQDLPSFYRINGAIYVTSVKSLLSKGRLFDIDCCYPYIMDQNSSVDIDTDLDFLIASAVIEDSKKDRSLNNN